jgi:hypothetical protein
MALNKRVMALLATEDISGLTRDQLSWLTRDQLSWLTGDQLSGLTGAQLSGLTGAQLSWLTRAQLSWLTRDQLSGLTGAQLSWLTRAQLSWLTRDQLSWLTGGKAIPVVPQLYSAILAGIKSEERVLKQSDFGPEQCPVNLCETPMCIAGHTVNLAGDAGYALVRYLGFACAAALIHRASSNAPLPRYDSYPDEWALAYIEARAKEESDAA